MGMVSSPLLIRADASPAMGTGHVMRCLAIAQAWSDCGGKVVFVSSDLPPFLSERLRSESFDVVPLLVASAGPEDIVFTSEVADRMRASILLIDGYHFGDPYRTGLRDRGHRIAAIDDFGRLLNADVIINANGYASLMDYQSSGAVSSLPVVLAGPHYALLRREFRLASNAEHRRRDSGFSILVTCGGSDPTNATAWILKVLNEIDVNSIRITVVVGGSFSRMTELQSLTDTLRHQVEVIQNCTNMPEVMSRADLAIAAAGSTCWELASLGVPIIALVTADNQIRVAQAIEELGLGWNLGPVQALRDERSEPRSDPSGHVVALSETGERDERSPVNHSSDAAGVSGRKPVLRQLVSDLERDRSLLSQFPRVGSTGIDGQGALRVARALGEPDVVLRPVTPDDSRQLWEWRNDQTVREVSFSSDPVPWENHCRWFSSRVDSAECRIMIAETASRVPVGQVRLDVSSQRATISISIAAEYRSAGFGRPMIRKATQFAFWQLGVSGVDAFIKPENAASLKVFQHCGFRLKTNSDKKPSDVSNPGGFHYVFETGSASASA